MVYTITPHTRSQAKRLGVEVYPSKRPGKKLDVFRGEHLVGSVGAKGYGDFGTYLVSEGRPYAEEKRKLYHARHSDGPKDSPAWLAKRLLW